MGNDLFGIYMVDTFPLSIDSGVLMSSAAIRQILISRMIPQEPRMVTVSRIHSFLEEYGITVSRRTVQRDLRDLSSVLDLQFRRCGKVQYWYYSNRRSRL